MRRKRLLLVAFHYPPVQGSSGVHRSLAFSKFLADYGWDVSVLTVVPRAYESILIQNLELVPEHVQVLRAQAWDAARHLGILGRYPSALARPDRWSSWIPFAITKALWAIHRDGFDAIFSTFPIASAHVVARRLRLSTRIPWIADFRDPMATDTYPFEPAVRRRWRSIQDDVVRESDRVTVTTEGAARLYRRMYPECDPAKFIVIENGFDPDLFAGLSGGTSERQGPGGPIRLLHSGILYPRERDPVPFLRAIRKVIDAGVLQPGSLRVCFRASGFDETFRPTIQALGLADVVRLEPALPYRDALREMLESGALLLFQAKVCNEQIPAKAYEYLAAGRPILGLADPEGDTGRLLARFGVPGIASLEDEEAIFRMLAASLPSIQAGTYPVADPASVLSVSRRAGTQELVRQLNRIAQV